MQTEKFQNDSDLDPNVFNNGLTSWYQPMMLRDQQRGDC